MPRESRTPTHRSKAGTQSDRRGADVRVLPTFSAGDVTLPSVTYAFDEEIDQETSWPPHAHPTHELLWNERGTSTVSAGNRCWSITPVVGVWMPAGLVHSATASAGTWYRATHFDPHTAMALADGPIAVAITPLLRGLLIRLTDKSLPKPSRDVTELMVLDVLTPAEQGIVVIMPTVPLLQPIVSAIRERPGDPRTLEMWAQDLGVSAKTITRTFRAETGLSFTGWLATVRAQHAIRLLVRGDDVYDIARDVGYASVSAFGAAFKRTTGVTPGAFRDVRFAT